MSPAVPRSSGEASGGKSKRTPAFRVERLSAPTDVAVEAIDALAAACGIDHGFSAREEFARPWSRTWILEPEGELAAFLVAWHVADELHILNVATRASFRRRGLGGALVRSALDYAKEQHVRIVLLEVRRSNRDALRLYRRLGFTAMGMRPGYYADNGEDAIEMTVVALDPVTGARLPGKDEIWIDVGDGRG